jgi:hypothetical protein
MTTQNGEPEMGGSRPPLPPEGPAGADVPDPGAEKPFHYAKPLQVPIANLDIEPPAAENGRPGSTDSWCVEVDANIAVNETVSVTLAKPYDPASGILAGPNGMIGFDLEPLDALLLADELRRAAEESVAPCPCGRTLANMRDFSDICDFNGEPTG